MLLLPVQCFQSLLLLDKLSLSCFFVYRCCWQVSFRGHVVMACINTLSLLMAAASLPASGDYIRRNPGTSVLLVASLLQLVHQLWVMRSIVIDFEIGEIVMARALALGGAAGSRVFPEPPMSTNTMNAVAVSRDSHNEMNPAPDAPAPLACTCDAVHETQLGRPSHKK
jgi:hypothetical protein